MVGCESRKAFSQTLYTMVSSFGTRDPNAIRLRGDRFEILREARNDGRVQIRSELVQLRSSLYATSRETRFTVARARCNTRGQRVYTHTRSHTHAYIHTRIQHTLHTYIGIQRERETRIGIRRGTDRNTEETRADTHTHTHTRIETRPDTRRTRHDPATTYYYCNTTATTITITGWPAIRLTTASKPKLLCNDFYG